MCLTASYTEYILNTEMNVRGFQEIGFLFIFKKKVLFYLVLFMKIHSRLRTIGSMYVYSSNDDSVYLCMGSSISVIITTIKNIFWHATVYGKPTLIKIIIHSAACKFLHTCKTFCILHSFGNCQVTHYRINIFCVSSFQQKKIKIVRQKLTTLGFYDGCFLLVRLSNSIKSLDLETGFI